MESKESITTDRLISVCLALWGFYSIFYEEILNDFILPEWLCMLTLVLLFGYACSHLWNMRRNYENFIERLQKIYENKIDLE
jgi:protein-S-isoprenylcysteine O-methyltransferase Ste14